MWQMIRQFLNTKQYLYYIGRHDILPPPLKGQQEKEIIEMELFELRQLVSEGMKTLHALGDSL